MEFLSQGFVQAFGLIFSGSEETWTTVGITLKLTALSMAATLALGLPLGFLLGYFDCPGKRWVRMVVDTLLALPTVVVGLLVYAFISNRGPFGDWQLLFTIRGMAIGQTLLALPIVVALTASAIEGLDRRLRLTLLTLGAKGWQMAALSLWECRYSIGMVCITAFGRVITEVGVAMMLGGNIRYATRTMTTAIALETSKGDFAQGIALGLVLLLMAFAVNLALAFFRHRGRA